MLPKKDQPKIYIIHENHEWTEPLKLALDYYNLPWEDWFVNELQLTLDNSVPDGIFYNRMSASSHTRNHNHALEIAAPLLAMLKANGKTVVNPIDALRLEVSKAEQYIALQQFGIQTPRSVAANSHDEILNAASTWEGKPFILKPNRGGKGTGVTLFKSVRELKSFLQSGEFEPSPDGISIIQDYIKPADNAIYRLEFIGGQFHYAVKVDVSEGFELCPADQCNPDDLFCPVGTEDSNRDRFSIVENYLDHKIPQFEAFLQNNNLHVAALEYVLNENGERYVYDINTNTNYNSKAEQKYGTAEKSGMFTIARYLGELLHNRYNTKSQFLQTGS